MGAKRSASRPTWTADIATMIAHNVRVDARCPTCDSSKYDIDLHVIEAAKGGDYDLWNRTTACTFTAGCQGRVHFKYMWRGGMWPRTMGD
jgi:5-methylcytosine-specific restriction endonuclease McrA